MKAGNKLDTVIYMVRHAKSPYKLGEERVRGLSEEGETDAKRVTELLSDKEISVIASSPYLRAIQTIEGLATQKCLQIIEFEELKERPIMGLEYKLTESEVQDAIEQSFHDKEYCLKEGETTNQAQERAIPVIKQLLNDYKGKKTVIGIHGNIMTIIMNYFDEQYGFEFWKSTTKPDIYELTFDEEHCMKEVNRLWS